MTEFDEMVAAWTPQECPKEDLMHRKAAVSRKVREAEIEAAERQKTLILQQMKAGANLHQILFTALGCIGAFSNDFGWAEDAKSQLNSVYGEMAQLSFLEDEAAKRRQEINERQRVYYEKLLDDLVRQKNRCKKIQKEIQNAYQQLEKLSFEPE